MEDHDSSGAPAPPPSVAGPPRSLDEAGRVLGGDVTPRSGGGHEVVGTAAGHRVTYAEVLGQSVIAVRSPVNLGEVLQRLDPDADVERLRVDGKLQIDVVPGDARYDTMFMVDGAPSEVAAELLDEPMRRWVRATRPGGFRIREDAAGTEVRVQLGQLDRGAVARTIELVATFAAGLADRGAAAESSKESAVEAADEPATAGTDEPGDPADHTPLPPPESPGMDDAWSSDEEPPAALAARPPVAARTKSPEPERDPDTVATRQLARHERPVPDAEPEAEPETETEPEDETVPERLPERVRVRAREPEPVRAREPEPVRAREPEPVREPVVVHTPAPVPVPARAYTPAPEPIADSEGAAALFLVVGFLILVAALMGLLTI